MNFSGDVTLGNIFTLIVLVGGWVWFFAKQSAQTEATAAAVKGSVERATTNRGLIDGCSNDVIRLRSRIDDHERRLDALDSRMAKLSAQDTALAKLTTDMEWTKATLKAVAMKLNVTPPPPSDG